MLFGVGDQKHNKLVQGKAYTSVDQHGIEGILFEIKSRNWDALWNEAEKRGQWTKPDPDVISIIPELKKENARIVLDLGCGVGRHTVFLASEGFQTYAVDSSPIAVKYCRAWLNQQNLHTDVTCADIQALSFLDEFCDAVISWNVIYHTTREGIRDILSEISRILRPRGLIYATLNSTRNKHCGIGTEIEPYTFNNPEKEDGENLHHYSDEKDAVDLLSQFDVVSLQESEQKSFEGQIFPGSWHWIACAKKSVTT